MWRKKPDLTEEQILTVQAYYVLKRDEGLTQAEFVGMLGTDLELPKISRTQLNRLRDRVPPPRVHEYPSLRLRIAPFYDGPIKPSRPGESLPVIQRKFRTMLHAWVGRHNDALGRGDVDEAAKCLTQIQRLWRMGLPGTDELYGRSGMTPRQVLEDVMRRSSPRVAVMAAKVLIEMPERQEVDEREPTRAEWFAMVEAVPKGLRPVLARRMMELQTMAEA